MSQELIKQQLELGLKRWLEPGGFMELNQLENKSDKTKISLAYVLNLEQVPGSCVLLVNILVALFSGMFLFVSPFMFRRIRLLQ